MSNINNNETRLRIGVFCSANNNIDPDFFALTEELGRWMGENGHTLVYGGCDMGLMRCIGHAVKNAGGMVIGVVPDKVEEKGTRATCLDVDIPVTDLSQRKDIMLLHSDVIIALPGGIGTLDEVFTVAAAKTIGYHQKSVILYNMKGFWDTTIQMLDDMQQRGMIRGDYHDFIIPVNSLEELIKHLTHNP